MSTLFILQNLTDNLNLNAVSFEFENNGTAQNGGDISFFTSDVEIDLELFGTGLAFGMGATPITGTVDVIELARDGSQTTPFGVIGGLTPSGTATLLGLDATTFITNGLTDAEESDFFFEALFGGSDDVFEVRETVTSNVSLSGDFRIVETGEFLTGGDDIIANRVQNGSTFDLVAADFGSGASVNGDAFQVAGTLVGGDDTIVASSSSTISGDTFNVGTQGRVFGGNDTISMFDQQGSFGRIIGDSIFNNSGGTVIGGNDEINGDPLVSGSGYVFVGDVDIQETAESFTAGGDDTINGSSGNDFIFGDIAFLGGGFASGGNDVLNGGAGNDTINGDVGTFDGGSLRSGGNDTISGGDGNDNINGNAGDDRIDGGFQNDDINGDEGDDFLIGGGGFDTIDGGIGNDVIQGNFNVDVLNGGDGNDTLIGGSGGDRLFGDSGDDVLNGGNGNDIIEGGSGNDNIDAGVGIDNVIGGIGDDDIFGGGGADVLNGGADNDIINGGNGADQIEGGSGNDSLFGDSGADTLIGGNGFDELIGGLGADVLAGGGNADTFIFENNFGSDAITDFSDTNNSENIDLSGVSSISNFADLVDNHLSLVMGVAVIDAGGGNTITLQGITTLANLDANDFLF